MDEQSAEKSILLHACCAPCCSAVLERLCPYHRVTVYYYNPNITEPEEYGLRLAELERFLSEFEQRSGYHVDLIKGEYQPSEYFEAVRGLEAEPEGGRRCDVCFAMRLESTARLAAELGFDCFDSSLSISPLKNYDKLCAAGAKAQQDSGVEYLAGNYKKKNGYGRSVQMSAEYGLYRQDYCGCIFSGAERALKLREKQ